MTLWDVAELGEYWAEHPPVHLLVAAFVGFKADAAPASPADMAEMPTSNDNWRQQLASIPGAQAGPLPGYFPAPDPRCERAYENGARLMPASCDDCGLCCKVLSVDEIDKPAGHWCRHIHRSEHGRSCGIYHERPDACRSFECIWLMSQSRPGQAMQPEIRPDRSHVVFCMDASVVLAADVDPENRILYAHVDPDWANAWRAPLPRLAIRTFLDRGGQVIVVIGKRRVLLRPGKPPLFTNEDDIALAVAAMAGGVRAGDLPPDLPPPTFDAAELMRRMPHG